MECSVGRESAGADGSGGHAGVLGVGILQGTALGESRAGVATGE